MRLYSGRSVALLGVFLFACGGSSTPTVPTPPTTQPKPAPTPTPTATPGPTVLSCTLPDLPTNKNCARDKKAGDGVYYQQVTGAIALLKQRKPDIFDGKAIRLVSHYYDGLIKILAEDYGLCAVRGGAGPADELAVKGDNSFSEQWDVLAGGSNGYSYPIWSYEVTCHPAAF